MKQNLLFVSESRCRHLPSGTQMTLFVIVCPLNRCLFAYLDKEVSSIEDKHVNIILRQKNVFWENDLHGRHRLWDSDSVLSFIFTPLDYIMLTKEPWCLVR